MEAAGPLDGQSRPHRNVSSCSMLSGFAGPIDQHNCFAKGIQSLTLLDTCYFLRSTGQGHRRVDVHVNV